MDEKSVKRHGGEGEVRRGSARLLTGTLGRGLMVASMLAGLGAVSGGCLTRKVATGEPTTKVNYTAAVRQSAIDKIDLLFAVDNSASMGDKQQLFAEAVPDLIDRFIRPLCVDDDGNPNGETSNNGECQSGKPEFQPVHDMHIGIVSSSLGARGGDQCAEEATLDNNDRGHLINRTKGTVQSGAGPAVANASPANFLAWLPSSSEKNKDKPNPPVPRIEDQSTFQSDFADLIVGVRERGCGYEAQLESAYRFLIQPDPYQEIVREGDAVRLEGIDETILKQRADFLRPDSLVAIIMLTDENESTIDPLAFGGRASRYVTGVRVKGGTSACETNPMDEKCISCFLNDAQGDSKCAEVLSANDDDLNVRFFHMKRRFGVDPRFPIERYVTGFTQPRVPNQEGEHPNGSFNYRGDTNCVNPLFATDLPTSKDQELCELKPGPRSPDLVFFALIGGVPWQLLTENPTDFSAANSAPFKAVLGADDWQRILGSDPLAYDFTGQDEHMKESIAPRSLSADDAPTREFDTLFKDLQFACTFPLPRNPDGSRGKDCTAEESKGACDCDPTGDGYIPDIPLCDATTNTLQVRGKAYPTISQLQVARLLGEQSIVASLCPREVDDRSSPDYGYRPAVRAIVDRLKNALAEQCLPQPLTREANGKVPCLILESFQEGDQATICDPAKGLKQAEPNVVRRFYEEQAAVTGVDVATVSTQPVCEVEQLVGAQLVNESCEQSSAAGWCYITAGASRTKCAQAIKFSPTGNPPVGARVHLQCINQQGGEGPVEESTAQ